MIPAAKSATVDEWFEMECPVHGGDEDIRPMPFPGDEVDCHWCGGKHIASAALGNPCRQSGSGEIEYIAEEWSSRKRPLSDDEIRAAVAKARSIAAPVGSMHAYWDLIADAECLLAGRPSILARPEVERMFREEGLADRC